MNEYKIVKINKIKQHEQINFKHMLEVKEKITKKNAFTEPIIIDQNSFVLLDGHHRLNSLLSLGYHKIPVVLVDYLNDKKIRVTTRRKNFKITKQIVCDAGENGILFPEKTSKHFIPYRVRGINIPLENLI
jgi:L-serine kinase (ADP)